MRSESVSSSVSGTIDATSAACFPLTDSPREVSGGTGLKAPMQRGLPSVCVGTNLARTTEIEAEDG